MNKLITIDEAIAKVKDGMTLMIGGFLANGTPNRLIAALVKSGVKDLTVICNDTGFPDRGIGLLITNKQVKKVIVSHIGTNPNTIDQMNQGTLEIEFSPQGTLAERVRSGGAGLGGFLTPTGLGTMIAEGKQTMVIDGKEYLLELPVRADIALLYCTLADKAGNLAYHGTTQNFNPIMATAADLVIAEPDQIIETGDLKPHEVKTSSIFVDYIAY